MPDTVHSGYLFNAESAAASVNSKILDFEDADTASFHFTSNTGTHVGTLKIQVSNDGSNWVDVSGLSVAVASGTANNDMLVLQTDGSKYARAAYTATSGTGTLTVIAHKKRLH